MTEATETASPPLAGDVDEQVRHLLGPRKGDWKRIAEASGGLVSYSWISKFMSGHIPGAKVDTLKAIRDWLVANPTLPTAAEATAGAAADPPPG